MVITVVVDAPKVKGSGYGGVVAAPVFKEIAEECIRYLGIRSSEYSKEWFESGSGTLIFKRFWFRRH